jgi:hypothetical protein
MRKRNERTTKIKHMEDFDPREIEWHKATSTTNLPCIRPFRAHDSEEGY